MIQVVGRGASSYVQRATHVPSGTHLALKVINMFDKSKRKQIMKEIESLYNAQCPALVTFYGAFHREGAGLRKGGDPSSAPAPRPLT